MSTVSCTHKTAAPTSTFRCVSITSTLKRLCKLQPSLQRALTYIPPPDRTDGLCGGTELAPARRNVKSRGDQPGAMNQEERGRLCFLKPLNSSWSFWLCLQHQVPLQSNNSDPADVFPRQDIPALTPDLSNYRLRAAGTDGITGTGLQKRLDPNHLPASCNITH